ncbi:hypothetical protein CAPTEDRAFT_214635 [Capitella teleta]|uniref:ETS domain-containing protein n=1 Tax=Capitella teleta TaxID=283909 RepID=R7UF33_CAPTE|nr:hypothetical protein CAPTEDRAFT_214635 [Capitella teleta]|eukprot:ELU05134.1 hypothetical protein CAPTEDRAFT_214635 [Capitella teleta]
MRIIDGTRINERRIYLFVFVTRLPLNRVSAALGQVDMKTLHPMEVRNMHEHVEFSRHAQNPRVDFKQQAVDYSATSNGLTFQEPPPQWELPVAIKDRVPSIGECLHMLHDFPDLMSGTAMVSVRQPYNVAMATPEQCLPVPEMYPKSEMIMEAADPYGGQGSSDDSVDWINDDLLHDVENTLEKMLTQHQQPPLISAANIKVEPNQLPLNECISYGNHKHDTENKETLSPPQMPQLAQSVSANEQHHPERQDAPQNAQPNTDSRSGLRPRKKRSRSKRQKMLWQFLLDILANPNYNPELITWINRQQGIFRFVQSRRVAQLWGDRRQRDMSYENMSRAMRHYYAANIMRRVDGRRLHYQFLENAKGWQEMASYPEELESTGIQCLEYWLLGRIDRGSIFALPVDGF